MASAKGIRAGKAYVEIGTDNNPLSRGLKAASQQIAAWGANLRQIGTGVAAAGTAITGPIGAAAAVFAAHGDALEKMSRRTGTSVEALSVLGFAAEQSGESLEVVEKGLQKMQRTIGNAARGTKTETEALARLGLTFAELQGMTADEQFKAIADRIAQIRDPAVRTAEAIAIFGRAGAQLIPIMEGGAKGIAALEDQARALGLQMSTEDAVAAADLTDAMNMVKRTLQAVTVNIGGAVAPIMTKLATRIAEVAGWTSRWIRENQGVVIMAAKVGAGVTLAGGALVGLGVALSATATAAKIAAASIALATAATKIAAITMGAVLSPAGLVIAALGGIGAAALVMTGTAQRAFEWFGETFAWLRDVATRTFGGIAKALAGGDFAAAAKLGLSALHMVWLEATAGIRDLWINVTSELHRAAARAFAGVQTAWAQVMNFMWTSMPKTTRFVVESWAKMTAGMKALVANYKEYLRNRFIEIEWIMSGRQFDLDEAKRWSAEDTTAERERIGRTLEADLQEAARRAGMTPEEHAAELERQIAEIDAALQRKLGDIDEAQAKRLQDAKAKLIEAREAWEAAAEAAEASADLPEQPAPPRRELDLSGVGAAIAQARETVFGTFSPAAAFGLGAKGDLDRLAAHLAAIEKSNASIDRKTEPMEWDE